MFQGFYNLTSGMLSQNRNMSIISNNMVNASTTGYKSDRYVSSTFQDQMRYRTGNMNKSTPVALNTTSMIRASGRTVTDFTQGSFEDTENILDFALGDPGYFVIQTEEGNAYSRGGAFSLDTEGYIVLPGTGRVMGQDGPIRLETDHITVESDGSIYAIPEGVELNPEQPAGVQGALLGRLQIVDFPDYEQLNRENTGIFLSDAQPQPTNAMVHWKKLERSNVDLTDQMTAVLTSQRALQSSSQMLKSYDQLMGRVVTEIGRL